DAMLLAASSRVAHGQRFIINDGWTTWREFFGPIVAPFVENIGNVAPGELRRQHALRRKGALKRACRAIIENPQFRGEMSQTKMGALASRLARRWGLQRQGRATDGQGAQDVLTAHAPPPWLEDLFGRHRT